MRKILELGERGGVWEKWRVGGVECRGVEYRGGGGWKRKVEEEGQSVGGVECRGVEYMEGGGWKWEVEVGGWGVAEPALVRILTPPQHIVRIFCHLHRRSYYAVMLRYFFAFYFLLSVVLL